MEKQRRRKKEQASTVPAPRTDRLIKCHLRVTDAWDQAIPLNPGTVVHNVRGENGGVVIEASLLIQPLVSALSTPRASPKFRIPRNP